ncbi:MAG TPA: nuclear transport factor 2 family protein [Vicinamibacterales bacterium]|nr:nuclear transport factor 2 family protein [Vicinamibacterales bacterium]
MRNALPSVLTCVITIALGVPAINAQEPADEALIREARARSNAAIAKHDLAGIAAFWMENLHVTTSTSALGDGRQPNQQRMSEQFKRGPDTVYVRTPIEVEVLAAWSVASEQGSWTGRWTEPDGVVEIGGTYLAQWRKIDGRWLIQSELYVPTHCKGSTYCSRRP